MPPGYGYGSKSTNTGKQVGGVLGPNQPPGVKSTSVKPKAFQPSGPSMNSGQAATLSGQKEKTPPPPRAFVPSGPSMNAGGKGMINSGGKSKGGK